MPNPKLKLAFWDTDRTRPLIDGRVKAEGFELDIEVESNGRKRWLEMAGCGMVDPAVLQAINERRGDDAYDPERVSGFAFGFGLDRLAINMAGVPDIRLFIESDQRFLSQFR